MSKTQKAPITIPELMKILKPSPRKPLMEMCADYLADIKEAQAFGDDDYEISPFSTKSGNPHVIYFDKN